MTNAVSVAQSVASGVSLGFKNRIINGAMMIDQRNSGAAITNTNASLYGIDRWLTGGLVGCTFTAQQVADAPAGFTYSNKISITSTTTSADYGWVFQRIEANNVLDLAWGTANAQSISVSFWAKANNAGVYNAIVKFFGSTSNYYYVHPYTLTANTWTYISFTVTGAPVGAGAYTAANISQYIDVSPLSIISSGYTNTATADTWSSSAYYKTSGTFNFASTSSATFQFTGMQLEVGTQATNFEYRDYGRELIMCQRYCWNWNYPNSTNAYARFPVSFNSSSNTFAYTLSFPVSMRAVPSFSWSGPFAEFQVSGGQTGTSAATGGDTNTNQTATIFHTMTSYNSFSLTGFSCGRINGSNTWSAIFSAEL